MLDHYDLFVAKPKANKMDKDKEKEKLRENREAKLQLERDQEDPTEEFGTGSLFG